MHPLFCEWRRQCNVFTLVLGRPPFNEVNEFCSISLFSPRFVDNKIVEPGMVSMMEQFLNYDACDPNKVVINKPTEQVVFFLTCPGNNFVAVTVSP